MATNTSFNVQNTEGIDYTQIYAPPPSNSGAITSEFSYPGLPFQVGQVSKGAGGETYLFCLSTSGTAINQAVGITQSPVLANQVSPAAITFTYDAAPLTKSLADQGCVFGASVVAITATYYGWVLVEGPAYVTLKNSCLPNVPLYTTASAGMLDDTSASQTRVYGIRARDTSTASGAAKICWISNATV